MFDCFETREGRPSAAPEALERQGTCISHLVIQQTDKGQGALQLSPPSGQLPQGRIDEQHVRGHRSKLQAARAHASGLAGGTLVRDHASEKSHSL